MIALVSFVVGGMLVLCAVWARIDYLEKKRREATETTSWTFEKLPAKTGPTFSMPLPSIPIEPIEYNLVPDTVHLPTWTPTVSHFPDQDHGPETTSQHDYDAISDHGSYDDGGSCDGGSCDGDAD